MPEQRSLARSGLLLAVVLTLCRLASLGKELFVAGTFGAGSAIDAYALAMLVPALGLALYVNAVRRGYLVEYLRRREQDEAGATSFTNRYLCQTLLVAVVLALLATFALPLVWPRVVPFDSASDLPSYLDDLSLPIAWLIVPAALVSALTAILNARSQFARPQWTHVLPTMAIVGAVLAAGATSGPGVLAWSLLIGTSIQAIVLAVLVDAAGHRFSAPGGSPLTGAGQFLLLVLPFVLMDVVGQTNVIVDRGMAAGLTDGSLSILYWSAMGKDFLSGTLVASVLWVLLPHFSEQVARADFDGLRVSCSKVLRYSGVLLIPLSFMLAVAGWILSVDSSVLGHLEIGNLDSDSLSQIGATVSAYCLGLFPELAGLALVQVLLVLRRWKLLAAVALLGLFLPNLLLNLWLIESMQEVGLALSTSLTAWILLASAWLAVQWVIGIEDSWMTLLSLVHSFSLTCYAFPGMLLVIWGLGAAPGDSGIFILFAGFATWAGLFGLLGLFWPGHADIREMWARLTRAKPPVSDSNKRL